MRDDNIRRDASDASAAPDRLTQALRDIPRMRRIEEEGGRKAYLPPPPMVSRIGGLAQGCGGVLLTLMGTMMVLVALWFGFYLWGPALILAGGMVLIFAAVGVWRGRRLPIGISAVVLLGLALLATAWSSFIPAAGALAPLGGFNVLFGPIALMLVLVLVAALVLHAIGLGLYWRRLLPPLPRSVVVWAVAAVALVVVALGLHLMQQQQRENWFDERLSDWTAEASDAALAMGSNTNVTLGYTFLTLNADDDPRFDLRVAELAAGLDAGAALVRVSASGDMLFEADTPRMFELDAEDDPEDVAEVAARIERQAALEADYLARLQESDADLYLADSQYTPYLLVWAADEDEDDITWEQFAEHQAQRVRHYAETLQPYAFEVVNEPAAYFQYSGITVADSVTDDERLDNWVAQTERLIAIVDEVSPETLVGVAINLGSGFDKDFYERALAVEGLDFISFRVFQPAAFDEIENLFADRGHPVDAGKQGWIAETWYGYCLAPQRSQELDGKWLATTAAFAAKERMSVVLVSDFGCFLEEGGTLFQPDIPLGGRTDVWERWAAVVEQWQAD